MGITRLDPADDNSVGRCHATLEAASSADDPFEPPQSRHAFTTTLFGSWSGAPAEAWHVPDQAPGQATGREAGQENGQEDGTAAAWCRIEFPDLENLNRAFLWIVVHPARRRAGLGTALLRLAAERAAANGRTVLSSVAQAGSAGEAFAAHAGATFGKADERRTQDLRKVPGETITRLRDTAARAAAGYSLIRWEGITPDELLEQVASLHNALNDAPRDAGVEPHIWDARQIRERHDAWTEAYGRRRYSVAAVHDATGEMAALTAVSVDPEIPGWGRQAVTMVTRPHRGHRLGLLVKADMLGWLATAEPRLEKITTWNAASNQHMIGINEALGYEVAGRPYQYAQLAVGTVLSPERTMLRP